MAKIASFHQYSSFLSSLVMELSLKLQAVLPLAIGCETSNYDVGHVTKLGQLGVISDMGHLLVMLLK